MFCLLWRHRNMLCYDVRGICCWEALHYTCTSGINAALYVLLYCDVTVEGLCEALHYRSSCICSVCRDVIEICCWEALHYAFTSSVVCPVVLWRHSNKPLGSLAVYVVLWRHRNMLLRSLALHYTFISSMICPVVLWRHTWYAFGKPGIILLAVYVLCAVTSQKYDVEERLGTPERLMVWMNAVLGADHLPCVSHLLLLFLFLLDLQLNNKN